VRLQTQLVIGRDLNKAQTKSKKLYSSCISKPFVMTIGQVEMFHAMEILPDIKGFIFPA